MTATNNNDGLSRFHIAPAFMFRWEESQQAFVLMYPEGIVKLNSTAGEILSRCTGEHTVTEIVDQLCEVFAEEPSLIEQRVHQFLEVCRGKGWIRSQS